MAINSEQSRGHSETENRDDVLANLDLDMQGEGINQSTGGIRWPLRMSEHRALLLVVDIALANGAILLGLWMWSLGTGEKFSPGYILSQVIWFPILNALWATSATLTGLYDHDVGVSLRRTAKALTQLVGVLIVAYLLIYFLSSPGALPRRFVLYFVTLSFIFVGSWRFLYTIYFGRSSFQRRIIIVGSGRPASRIAQVIWEHAAPHYQVVGCVDDNAEVQKEAIEVLPLLGTTSKLSSIAEKQAVSEVVVASVERPAGTLVRSLVDCREHGIQVTPMSAIYEEVTGRVPLNMAEDGWTPGAIPPYHASVGVIFPLVKRSLDILLSVTGLIGLGLVLPFVAIAIRLDSPGPLFYSQYRVGKAGKKFRTYKIRSMKTDAEKDGKPIWAEWNDPRVTRVGRFLRTTHIDEFPQFLNILKGEMSVVGPRPERPEIAAELEKEIPFYRLRHSVRPGMAGWALINQGYTGTVGGARVKLEYDLYYIKHQGLVLDWVIMLKTIVDTVTLQGR